MTITSRPLGRQKFSVVVGQTEFTPIQPVVALGGSGTYTYTMSAFTFTAVVPPFVLPTAPQDDGVSLLKANSLLGADPIIVPPSGTEATESLPPIRIIQSTGVVIITSITHLIAGVYEATITVTDGTSSLVQTFTLEVLANPAPYITTISLSGANYSALDYVQSATLVNAVCEQILAENTSITIYYVNLSEGSVILTVGSSGPFGPPTSTFNLGGGIVLTNATPTGCIQVSVSSSGQYQTIITTNTSGGPGLIYQSTTYGASWVLATGAPSAILSVLSMSASGQYQTACSGALTASLIYVSTNYGDTWEALPGSPTYDWTSIGMSSDGQYQTAVGLEGVYTWTNVICLLETCNLMLTDGSYKNVKSIKTGDILRSALNGTDLHVLHCGYNVVRDLSRVPVSNHPMRIPEGFFAEGSPSRDVFISGHHRLFFTLNETTVGIQVFKLLPETNTLTMDKALEVVGSDVLKYYHVEVEGGKNAVFCDGLPVETLEAGEWESSRIEN